MWFELNLIVVRLKLVLSPPKSPSWVKKLPESKNVDIDKTKPNVKVLEILEDPLENEDFSVIRMKKLNIDSELIYKIMFIYGEDEKYTK